MVKRHRTDLPPSEHDPGTPDEMVSDARLAGREAARNTPSDVLEVELHVPKKYRTDWWLGWYDERLKRFYGRA